MPGGPWAADTGRLLPPRAPRSPSRPVPVPPGRAKSSAMNGERGGSRSAFPGLPGEVVLEEAAGVRLRCREGDGSVPGTLVCTNLRVAFLAAPGHGVQPPGSIAPLQSEHNVALPCIRKLVAGKGPGRGGDTAPRWDKWGRGGGSAGADSRPRPAAGSSFTKAKVLTAASTLKFIPEELLIFCRDFRLLRFHFHENGLAPQAYRVANAIAQARETATWPWDSGDSSSWAETKPEEEEEDEGEEEEEEGGDEEGSAPTLLFESLPDWEKELKRQGAAGWRVSAINERFDMAPSLPRYLWVPSGLLDHDLKRTFAHFEERRVPRLCWHHPGGSDLLRSAGFHAASEPGSEDVRCLEALLRAGRGPCVLADTAELPTLADIQLAHLKLWALCLHGAAPEEKWLSALEATRWLDHVRPTLKILPPRLAPHPVSGSPHHPQQPQGAEAPRRRGGDPDPTVCGGGWRPPGQAGAIFWGALTPPRTPPHPSACLRKAVEVASLLAGRRCCVLLQEPSDRDLNCLLASLVQLLADPHARTLPGFQSLVQREWVAAGHPFPRRLGLRRGSPREEAPVFPLFLDCTWQLVRQFPAAFGFTEAFLLALHDGGFQPYCGTFLFTCQRQRGRGGPQQPRGQTYTPVNGCWDPPAGSRLPPVWDWALRYSPQQRARFRNPAGGGGGTLSPPDTESPQTTATRGRFAPSPAGLAEELTLLQDRLSAWQAQGPRTRAAGSPLAPSR
ncbi:Myotubularin-related protein 11 [Aix galericulata]|nr:Myotubularin-related protein 11 [Aix galericulata]